MGEIFSRPLPAVPLPFTGERLTSELTGETEIEHLHRYLLAREFCRGKDVLDIASGEGYGSALIAQTANSVVGVEIAPDAVQHAQQSYHATNLRYACGDARTIPLSAASVDVVVSFETLEHFAEQGQFIEEVRRVLRDGGLLIVSTPDRDNYSPAEIAANPYHIRELTRGEFESLLHDSFRHVSFLLQRPMIGSVMMPGIARSADNQTCFERRGMQHFESSDGLARARYLIGFASDEETKGLSTTVYIETSSLGDLGRSNARELDALRSEQACRTKATESLSRELESMREQMERLAQEREAAVGTLSRSDAKLEILNQEHSILQNRLKECLLQNSSLVAEINKNREHAAVTEAALARMIEIEQTHDRLEHEIKRLNDIITNLLASTSWRVTAPLRGVRQLSSTAIRSLTFSDRTERAVPMLVTESGPASPSPPSDPVLALPSTAAVRPASPAPRDSSRSDLLLSRARGLDWLPISVVIPTYNRASVLEETLRSCVANAISTDIELIVIDDGSTDGTAETLSRLEHEIPNLVWRTRLNGGPGTARNLGASLAKHPVVLFMGDDIKPVDHHFFEVHARLHAIDRSDTIAVLGKIIWPDDKTGVGFVMTHIQGRGGEQFAYAHLNPHTFLDWRFFYTANISVKKSLVTDWLEEGFLPRFTSAAFEDGEFALRMQKRPHPLKIYYDPASVGEHLHPYTTDSFIQRQTVCGMMAKILIELHPEAAELLQLTALIQTLDAPLSFEQERVTAEYMSVVEGVKSWVRILEQRKGFGNEWWHDDLLGGVFELAFFHGFVTMNPKDQTNFANGYEYILKRFVARLRTVIHRELTDSIFLRRLGLSEEAA